MIIQIDGWMDRLTNGHSGIPWTPDTHPPPPGRIGVYLTN